MHSRTALCLVVSIVTGPYDLAAKVLFEGDMEELNHVTSTLRPVLKGRLGHHRDSDAVRPQDMAVLRHALPARDRGGRLLSPHHSLFGLLVSGSVAFPTAGRRFHSEKERFRNSQYGQVNLCSNLSLWEYEPVSIATTQHKRKGLIPPEKQCHSMRVSTLISLVGEIKYRVRPMVNPP